MDIAVLALARNCEKTLPRTLDAIASLGFKSRVVIGEDGSTDATRRLIQERAELVDTGSIAATAGRLTKMAAAREAVKAAYEQRDQADLVVVVDMDGDFMAGVDSAWLSYAHNRLLSEREVFALAATSSPYYDLLAYESEEISFAGLDLRISKAQRNPFKYARFKQEHVYSVQEKMTRDVETLCISAFNGIAIYLGSRYAQGSYVPEAPTLPVCEHVTFNRGLSRDGSRMIVDPSLVVPAPAEHVRQPAKDLWSRGVRKVFSR